MPPPPPPLTILNPENNETTTTTTHHRSNPPPPPPLDRSINTHIIHHHSSSAPITLKFVDLSYALNIAKPEAASQFIPAVSPARPPSYKTILSRITGIAYPGEILAVLGPSGSGKSTLLNLLSGRLHPLTGTLLANGRPFTRSFVRRLGFVPQDDLLYPHLTVRETLIFCSLLRLPSTLPKSHKINAAESVISDLGLAKCQHTIIGNGFVRGVSGGERKRVSIAHEMLVNPSLLILDEPTSGLDSTAAHRLVATLGAVAQKGRRTVVASMHQPSSRVFQMVDKVLLLSEGVSLYYGKAKEAMPYFESVGFSPAFPMNPADFLLDLANGVCHVDVLAERDKLNVRQSLISSYNNVLAPKVNAACIAASEPSTVENHNGQSNCNRRNSTNCRQFVSAWFNQFSILLQRSVKERRHESFNTLRVFQVMAASLLAGFMWWHSDYRDVQDRLGLLFFFSIFWGVLPSSNSVFAFPQEQAISVKERASGMYTLSSYFMARMVGDWPMELILPTMFLAVTYWMTGLKPELGTFLLTLAVLLGYVLVSQGLGLALGAAIMDSKQASTIVTVAMLAFVLTGGYYVHSVPSFLSWVKYISTTFHCYRLLIHVQYGDGEAISSLLGCFNDHPHDTATCKFIKEDIRGQIHPLISAGVMLAMFFGFRILAYLALKRVKV
uniref:ABC transporter domain-containing protein n=1 Tax=Kalanchoe fedtschenkoi TaxID=63787 RepID=A0A7N0RC10_KALFE